MKEPGGQALGNSLSKAFRLSVSICKMGVMAPALLVSQGGWGRLQ